jgi:hypothetical protein
LKKHKPWFDKGCPELLDQRKQLTGTHQLLAYADDVNLPRDNIDTVKKHTETLIEASKEVDLKINIQKTKCMLLSHHRNVGQNYA